MSTAPGVDELELIALLADHPSLIATVEADKAFWLLTHEGLRAMYSAARAGQGQGPTLIDLAPAQLPSPSAAHVLSGKYVEAKDPSSLLAAMTRNLDRRRSDVGLLDLKKSLGEAQRSGNRELARALAQLAEAERKGDRELVARIKSTLDSSSSDPNGKQVD